MTDDYIQPINNSYFDFDEKLEDVDDNAFLNNSRRRSTNNGNGSNIPTNISTGAVKKNDDNNALRQQQLAYEQKRRAIEERSLQSTQRSLGLLYDTEEVGNATAVELAKQREQLERTNKNLDDINATLRYSQRHLNGIKSVFGSLKNYFSGNRDSPQPSTTNTANNERKLSVDSNNSRSSESAKGTLSPSEKYDHHPISRLRDDSTSKQQHQQMQQARSTNAFEDQLEANLHEMANNLSRLKGLATDLGSEIESQNELLDNMTYKIEDVDIKIAKQNKDMFKLLGKK